MSTEDDIEEPKTEPTFTRAQMAKMVNAQVKEKLAAALAGYGDLDELRTKAAEADKSKTQLDRIEQQFSALTQRAEKAERETLLRGIAEELGISMRLAGRLQGKTREELLADGRETMEDLGIKPGAKKTSKPAAVDGDVEDDGDGSQDDQQEPEEALPPREPARRSSRPREALRSGAPRTVPVPEETDPLKLAALIPRR